MVACPQLAIGDSTLRLTFNRLRVNGTFAMGTPACPIASSITVTVPGGDETYGVDNAGSYDVHGVMQVGRRLLYCGSGVVSLCKQHVMCYVTVQLVAGGC